LALIGLFRSRASLQAEILMLRHQLNVLRRKSPQRLTFTSIDRPVFAGLYRLAPGVLDALKIVRPETVIRWHRADSGSTSHHACCADDSTSKLQPVVFSAERCALWTDWGGSRLIAGKPLGFVAILGVLALVGMIVRNSVILVDQIDTEIAHGRAPWDAVIEATLHRFRPILLTAAAAILGMIPIAPTVFWGPMAYSIMGGLAVATMLTLLFLPALYVAWFRIKEPSPQQVDRADPSGQLQQTALHRVL
jgi:hypothetical protein